MENKKSLEDVLKFLESNAAEWKKELDSIPDFKASREGAIQVVDLVGRYLTGEFDVAAPEESETDAEEAAAEATP